MSRSQLIRSGNLPYSVISRVQIPCLFTLDSPDVWNFFLDELHRIQQKKHLCIHSFVLMKHHFHLLCHTPEKNLDDIMHLFLVKTSWRFARGLPLWIPNYKWSLIREENHYDQIYRYVYQNPLRQGLSEKVEDYSFSTLRSVPFSLVSYGREKTLSWLNERYSLSEEKLIELGLRKYCFDVSQRNARNFKKLS